jgi:hypothetical protein
VFHALKEPFLVLDVEFLLLFSVFCGVWLLVWLAGGRGAEGRGCGAVADPPGIRSSLRRLLPVHQLVVLLVFWIYFYVLIL